MVMFMTLALMAFAPKVTYCVCVCVCVWSAVGNGSVPVGPVVRLVHPEESII